MPDQAQIHLNRKEQELNNLRQANAELKRKVQELSELHNRNKANLQKELDDCRKRWRQACFDLNKFQARGQGICQVTDNELQQKATQLRFNIRNFAEQQFRGELRDAKDFSSLWNTINKYLRKSFDSFKVCKKDRSRAPKILGVFLWAFLKNDVFDKFCWAGTQVSRAMLGLGQILSKESLFISF